MLSNRWLSTVQRQTCRGSVVVDMKEIEGARCGGRERTFARHVHTGVTIYTPRTLCEPPRSTALKGFKDHVTVRPSHGRGWRVHGLETWGLEESPMVEGGCPEDTSSDRWWMTLIDIWVSLMRLTSRPSEKTDTRERMTTRTRRHIREFATGVVRCRLKQCMGRGSG